MKRNRLPLLIASAFLLAGCANSIAPEKSTSDAFSSETSSSLSKETSKYTIVFDMNGGTSDSYVASKGVNSLSSADFFFDCKKTGYNFRGWSYNGVKVFNETGKQLISPTMESTMTFVAVFANDAKMTIVTNMEEAGTIKGDGYYEYNTDVSVLAEPNQGYNFLGWYNADGIPLSSQKSYNYRMSDCDVTIEARFELATFGLSIKSNNDGLGVVYINPTASTTVTDYSGNAFESVIYTHDVKIAANTKTDVRFLGWFDEESTLISTNPVYSFTMPNHDYYLEAKWNSFAINYDTAGGTNDSSNPSSVSTDQEASLADPYREGYVFKGWYDRKTGEKVTTIALGTLDDVDLIAKWEPIVYAINYELSGGENASGNPETYTIEDNVSLGSPTKMGYRFDGWYKETSLSTKVSYISQGSTGDKTFYAKWTAVSYAITYELNGGTNNIGNPETFTIEDEIVFKDPARKGFDFKGWYADSSLETKIEKISAGTIDGQNVYAKWEAIAYSISYELNGGENNPSNPNYYTIEDNVTLTNPSRSGYFFAGWYANGVEITCVEEGNVGDIILEARWETVAYAINYNLNGGKNDSSNPTSFTIEDSVFLKAPSKLGYDFKGWYSDENLTEKVETISSGTIGEVTLYASWEPINYSIAYRLNGGQNDSSNPETYNTEESVSLASPSRPGYEFAGWYKDGEQIDLIEKGSIGNITLEAEWTAIPYSISYELGGGTNSDQNPNSYSADSNVIVFSSAQRDGYTFEGWFSDADYSKDIKEIPAGSYGNLELWAKWSADSHRLSISSSDESQGNTQVISGSGYTDEKITVKASGINGCAFKGWYNGENLISRENPFTFAMPASDYSLVAKFWTKNEAEQLGAVPVIDSSGETLTYGIYPQSRVTETTIIAALEDADQSDTNGWYFLDGKYYAKATADPCQDIYSFNDGTSIVDGDDYWFECEPIKWRILSSSNGEYSLLSTVLLDTHKRGLKSGVSGFYANNYAQSAFREWLNGDFYNTAFSLGNSFVQTVQVDNSASTTDSTSNQYACANTEDKVYLLSYQDYLSEEYFGSWQVAATARRCELTEWARANHGCYAAEHADELGHSGYYWTRSPSSDSEKEAWSVDSWGGFWSWVLVGFGAARPAITIGIPS